MNEAPLIAPEALGSGLSDPAFAMVLAGAVLLRLIPILILISTLIKLRRFPQFRTLQIIVLSALALIATLALIDIAVPSLVPTALRTSGAWAFAWIFAAALLCVSWTRSAIKTRLRPRLPDIATLSASAVLALALALPLGTLW